MTVHGHVAIVGGGPGAPDLITVRGWDLLSRADIVLTDHLGPLELLERLPPGVEVIDVGKHPHETGPTTRQEQINGLLVEHARAGRRVVRLKGGDPFVFGRGGEEALACAEAGIAAEVVPGVSSAIAVPALAGIPVTHRGISQEVTIVSGHVPPGDPNSTVDWERLGAGKGTVVVLMGVYHMVAIATALRDGGRSGSTPMAVLGSGSTPDATMWVGTLDLVLLMPPAVDGPAVLVVGAVVELASLLTADTSAVEVRLSTT